MNSPTQLLNELRERYCDLTLDDRLNVKREMQFLSTVIDSPEMILALAIAELNGLNQKSLSDLQSLKKVAGDLQSLRKGA